MERNELRKRLSSAKTGLYLHQAIVDARGEANVYTTGSICTGIFSSRKVARAVGSDGFARQTQLHIIGPHHGPGMGTACSVYDQFA